MFTRLASPTLRGFCCAAVFVAGAASMPGCGGGETAPVGVPGAAPVDNDDAARQKAMEDFMKQESSKKK